MTSTAEGSSSRPSSQPSGQGTGHAGTAWAPLSPSHVLMKTEWTGEKLGFAWTAPYKQLGCFGYTTACSAPELAAQPAKGYLSSWGSQHSTRRKLCPQDLDAIELADKNGQAAFAAWMLQKARTSPPPGRHIAHELRCFLNRATMQQQKSAIVYDIWLHEKMAQQHRCQWQGIAAVNLQHLRQSEERTRDAKYWASVRNKGSSSVPFKHSNTDTSRALAAASSRTTGSHAQVASGTAAHIEHIRAYRRRQTPPVTRISNTYTSKQ